MRRNIGYGRVSTVLPYLVQDGYGRRPSAGRAQGRGAGERRPARHLPAGPRWPAVVPRAQAHRSRAAAPEPGLPAGEPRSAQRVVRRRRGVEHRDHRALPHHLRAAARCPRPPTGRHADLADVRVRAVARSRLPGRRLAARGLPGAAGPRPDPSIPATPRCPSTGGPTSPCPSRTTFASSHPRTPPGSSPPTGASVGCRSPSSKDGTAPTRRARRRPPTTSSRSTTTSVAGSLRWTAGAPDWCRPRPTCFAAASSSCGDERRRGPLAGVALRAGRGVPRDPGGTGPDPARAPADAGTCLLGLGRGVRTARERPRTPSTRADWSLARRAVARDLEALVPRAALDRVLADTAALGRHRAGRGAEHRLRVGCARTHRAGGGRRQVAEPDRYARSPTSRSARSRQPGSSCCRPGDCRRRRSSRHPPPTK